MHPSAEDKLRIARAAVDFAAKSKGFPACARSVLSSVHALSPHLRTTPEEFKQSIENFIKRCERVPGICGKDYYPVMTVFDDNRLVRRGRTLGAQILEDPVGSIDNLYGNNEALWKTEIMMTAWLEAARAALGEQAPPLPTVTAHSLMSSNPAFVFAHYVRLRCILMSTNPRSFHIELSGLRAAFEITDSVTLSAAELHRYLAQHCDYVIVEREGMVFDSVLNTLDASREYEAAMALGRGMLADPKTALASILKMAGAHDRIHNRKSRMGTAVFRGFGRGVKMAIEEALGAPVVAEPSLRVGNSILGRYTTLAYEGCVLGPALLCFQDDGAVPPSALDSMPDVAWETTGARVAGVFKGEPVVFMDYNLRAVVTEHDGARIDLHALFHLADWPDTEITRLVVEHGASGVVTVTVRHAACPELLNLVIVGLDGGVDLQSTTGSVTGQTCRGLYLQGDQLGPGPVTVTAACTARVTAQFMDDEDAYPELCEARFINTPRGTLIDIVEMHVA